MYIYIPGMEQMLTISCFQDNSDNALSSLLRWGKNYIRVLLSHKQQVATGPFGLLCMCVKSLLSCLILCDLMGYSLQPRSMGFSRQEYWSGLPCPPLGDLPDPGIEPVSITSPALAGRLFTTSTNREALGYSRTSFFLWVKIPCRTRSFGVIVAFSWVQYFLFSFCKGSVIRYIQPHLSVFCNLLWGTLKTD